MTLTTLLCHTRGASPDQSGLLGEGRLWVGTGHLPCVADAPDGVPSSNIDHYQRRSQHPFCPPCHPGGPADPSWSGLGMGLRRISADRPRSNLKVPAHSAPPAPGHPNPAAISDLVTNSRAGSALGRKSAHSRSSASAAPATILCPWRLGKVEQRLRPSGVRPRCHRPRSLGRQ